MLKDKEDEDDDGYDDGVGKYALHLLAHSHSLQTSW